MCYDILREARQFNPREFRVIASATAVEMLLDEDSQHLAGLSEFIGKPISLSPGPVMSPEQYDSVPMQRAERRRRRPATGASPGMHPPACWKLLSLRGATAVQNGPHHRPRVNPSQEPA